jgi:hypothetical protein
LIRELNDERKDERKEWGMQRGGLCNCSHKRSSAKQTTPLQAADTVQAVLIKLTVISTWVWVIPNSFSKLRLDSLW